MKPLEKDEQEAFVARCKIEKICVISIENSLQLPKIVNKNLIPALVEKRKKQGMLIGCPDLFLPKYKLFIEMKRRDGGVLSEEQKKIHELLKSYGYQVEVCHGAASAWQKVKEKING